MPLPDRPVSLTTIDSEWGQAVHDYTFAPKGCDLYSTTTTSPGTTPAQCNLDLVNDDPAGFLDAANDQAVVPAGGEGLYYLDVRLNTVGSSAQTRVLIYLNGARWRSGIEDGAGGTNVVVDTGGLITLTAGDTMRVYAQRQNSGTNPDVKVLSFQLVRLGAEYGA